MQEKFLFSLYQSLLLETRTSQTLTSLILWVTNIQYLSFQFDNNVWVSLKYLSQRLIELVIRILGLTRISILYRLSRLGDTWHVLPFLIAFISTFGTMIIFVFLLLEVKECHDMNEKLGYDFEFLEMASFQEIGSDFQKKQIKANNTTGFFSDSKSHLLRTHHNLKIFILKIYNIFLPILVLPFTEVYMDIIDRLVNGDYEFVYVIYGILSILGIFILFSQVFFNTLLFNNFAFDPTRNLNRNVRISDLLWPFSNAIGPIIACSFRNVSYFYYIHGLTQFIVISYLLMKYINYGSYFNPEINEIYGACLIFRLFVILIFFLCTFLEDHPGFFIIFLSLSLKLSINLSKFIRNRITNNLDLKTFDFKEFGDDSSQIQQKKDFSIVNSKFLALFSNFYYLKESVKCFFFQIIEEIPLNYIGSFRDHLNICTKSYCPLLKNPEQKSLEPSRYYLKKLTLEINWVDKEKLKTNISKYISEIYKYEANIMTFAKNETKFLYILFLLFYKKGLTRSILTLNSLFMRNLSFFERFIIFSMREFMGKYLRIIEEKSITQSREKDFMAKNQQKKRLKKEETRFDCSIFIELEKNFNLLKKNIEIYVLKLKSFIKELTLEKVSISFLEEEGKFLLSKFKEIKECFSRANKNIRFIKVYRDFITIFKEDDWALRRDLTKLLHLINQVEENYETAESNHGGSYNLTDETHFFTDKSCFLNVSGLERDIGRILKTDENMATLFGYKNSNTMIGISIDELMPKLFGEKHKLIMLNYLENGESNFIYRDNRLFGLNKKGFIFPMNITVKPYLNRNNYSLEFIAHIKPTSNKRETLIIVDEFGNIDSFGEDLEDIFNKFYERNRRQNIPIQVLIPDLMDFFEISANNFIKENLEILESNRAKRSMKNRNVSYVKSFKSTNYLSTNRKSIKTRKRSILDKTLLFSNFLKNEFGDIIFQIVLKDNYPTFPLALDMNYLEAALIMNYMNNLKEIVRSNESPCDVYRIDISIETRLFSEIAINILRVRRIKHLYRNKTNDSIEKVLKRAKRNRLTLLPKILKQTGILRICKRKKEEILENKSDDEETKKDNKHNPKLKRRRNSDITDCPQLYIEEIFGQCTVENKTEMEKKLIIEELIRDQEKISSQKALSFGPLSDNEEDKKISLKESLKNNNSSNHIIIKKEKKYSKKVKTQISDGVDKEFLKPPLNDKSLMKNDNLNLKKENNSKKKKLFKILSRTVSNVSLLKREKQKYYADEGRYLYKIQSKENSVANLTQTEENENEKHYEPSIASSLLSNTRDSKNEFRRLMDQIYLPNSYKNILFLTAIAFFLSIASFFAYGGLSNQMMNELSSGLFSTELVENYKINILKLLIIQQNKLTFQTMDNMQEFNNTYVKLRQLDYQIRNPPLEGLSNDFLLIEIGNNVFQSLSVITGMNLFFEAIEGSLHNETGYEYFIINNGLELFRSIDGLFSFTSKIQDKCDEMKTNLMILVLISLTLMSFFIFSIMANIYYSHKFINSTIKLLCSITIKDYKITYNTFFENNYMIFENNEFPQSIIKNPKTITSQKEDFYRDNSSKNNNGKKKIRHQVIPLVFSKLNFLSLAIFLIIYTSLFIVDLNQSQLLDSTLTTKLINKNIFNNIRINMYYLLALLNDRDLGYIKAIGDETLQIQHKLLDIGNNLNSVLKAGNYFSGSEKVEFDNALNTNLCVETIFLEFPGLYEKCLQIGSGALTHGLYSAFMSIYQMFNAIIDRRSFLNNSNTNEDMILILSIVDLSSKKYFSDSIGTSANQLKDQSVILLIVNSFMACGVCCVLLLFLLIIVKRYERRIILAKRILGLIPFYLISKSQKIKKYLNLTKKSKKI